MGLARLYYLMGQAHLSHLMGQARSRWAWPVTGQAHFSVHNVALDGPGPLIDIIDLFRWAWPVL